MSSISIAGVVLAGGNSSRMGGGNKTLLELDGRTLLAHVVERLSPQVGAVAISANDQPAAFAAYALPVLPDRNTLRQGPLAGILSGLNWAAPAGFSHLASASGDTPFLPLDLVARLAEPLDRAPELVAIAASNGRPQPGFALWPVALADRLANHLETSDDLSVMAFARAHGQIIVDFRFNGGHDPFFNVNRPTDLESARSMAQRVQT